jgi:WD40 repeat protein
VPLYDAFISYSHAKDKPIAASLQSVVQTLGKPWYRRRALRVFRDDTSLSATPHLWPSIEKALSESRHLILLASPEAAKSPWIAKEVEYWFTHKSSDTLFIGLTDGELSWDGKKGDFNWSPETPLPKALEGRFAHEPKWVDLSAYRDGANPHNAHFIELGADFAAAIRGMPKEDLLSREVRQQRRALTLATGAAASLLVLAGAAAWQWREAEAERVLKAEQLRQSQINESRYLGARATEALTSNNIELAKGLLSMALPKRWSKDDRPVGPGSASTLHKILESDSLDAIFIGHEGPVQSAAYSMDERRILTASDDGTARLWDATTGELLSVLRHEEQIYFAEFSADKKLILTKLKSKVGIWDAATGKLLRVLAGDDSWLETAGFSPEGHHVLTASYPDTVRIWDADTGNELNSWRSNNDRSATFSPTGDRILTQSEGDRAQLWDRDGKLLRTIFAESRLTSIQMSGDGKRVLTGAEEGQVQVWNADTGVSRKLVDNAGPNARARFSPGGGHVLTYAFGKDAVHVFDTETGQLLRQIRIPAAEIYDAAFTPDEKRLLTLSSNNIVRIFDIGTGDLVHGFEVFPCEIKITADMDQCRVNDFRFSADGSHLLTASGDKLARAWKLSDPPPPLTLEGHSGEVNKALFSPDDRQILTVSDDKTARLWDATTGKQIWQLDHTGGLSWAAFSPDGKLAAISSWDGTAKIVDVAGGSVLKLLKGHEGGIKTITFNPRRTLVATTSVDGTARIWDIGSGETLHVLKHDGPVNTAFFSPDGASIVTASYDGTARIWDVDMGLPTIDIDDDKGTLSAAFFSPDGKRVLTADGPRLHLRDSATGAVIREFDSYEIPFEQDDAPLLVQIDEGEEPPREGDGPARIGSEFSSDGKVVVMTGSLDRAILWSTETGEPLRVLEGHRGALTFATLSPDGKRVLTGSEDGTARIWDMESGELESVLRIGAGPAFGMFSHDGRRVVLASQGAKVQIWDALPALPRVAAYLNSSMSRPLTWDERRANGLGEGPDMPTREGSLQTVEAETKLGRELWVEKQWERALFHFNVAMKTAEENGLTRGHPTQEAMLYRANLARRLPMERVAEIWELAQNWKPDDPVPDFGKRAMPTAQKAAPLGATAH